MRGKSELYWSFVVIAVITFIYLIYVVFSGVPEASSFFGHVLGVSGFLLMLATELLYSLRKRAIIRPWGQMQSWLKFHIITGIVGPYMVFLHAAWSFNGLAGVVILLAGVVVLSGFIGRYIYTSVPRTADGLIIAAETMQANLRALEVELQSSLNSRSEVLPTSNLLATAAGPSVLREAKKTSLREIIRSRKKQELSARDRAVTAEIESMQKRQRKMQRQIKNLALARRSLSVWHKIHIPLGMAMFTAALIHIGAAVYFGSMLR